MRPRRRSPTTSAASGTGSRSRCGPGARSSRLVALVSPRPGGRGPAASSRRPRSRPASSRSPLKNRRSSAPRASSSGRRSSGPTRRALGPRPVRRVPETRRPAADPGPRGSRAGSLAARPGGHRRRWSGGSPTRARSSRRLPEHQAALAALRRRGTPASLEREPGVDPVIDRLRHTRGSATPPGGGPLPRRSSERRAGEHRRRRSTCGAARPGVRREAASRPVYRFAAVEDQWVHDNLERLVARLEDLAGPSRHDGTIASVESGVAVARAFARSSQPRTGQPPRGTRPSGRSPTPATDPAYGGLRIEPILGLVPIGRDPKLAVVGVRGRAERDSARARRRGPPRHHRRVVDRARAHPRRNLSHGRATAPAGRRGWSDHVDP